MSEDMTSITLDTETRDRLRGAKIGGESYSQAINRILDTNVGYLTGQQVTVENVTGGRVRIKRGDDWIEPGSTVKVWSEDPDVIRARKSGYIEVVDQ